MNVEQRTYKPGDLVATVAPQGYYLAVVGDPPYTPRSGHLLIHIVKGYSGWPHSKPVRRVAAEVRPLGTTWLTQTGQGFRDSTDGKGRRPSGTIDVKKIRRLKERAGLVQQRQPRGMVQRSIWGRW